MMKKLSSSKNSILLIGGAGYVGSHMLRVLLKKGITPVVFDNLSSGFRKFIPAGVPFVKGDLREPADIRAVFKKYPVSTVMHFASSIIVPESVANPLKYYENNVASFIHLMKAMDEHNVRNIIFSSTAAVYAEPKIIPIPEDAPLIPANPYGWTKLMCERLIQDYANSRKDFSYVIFRYFNVAGAHDDGGIGESHEPETHLIPIVLETALGKRPFLPVFGDDYKTPDGTCIRDYIHVQDLCEAHYLAFAKIRGAARNQIFNLGSQKGYSVKQVVDAARRVAGKDIPVRISPRRPGDSARLIASSRKAGRLLAWKPRRDLGVMIASAWEWERQQ